MTNSGFFQLFDRHEREDYNATLSEAAIRPVSYTHLTLPTNREV